MKLSISNIAWSKENDTYVYCLMKKNNFIGLEIAPTRFFEITPYSSENILRMKTIAENLKNDFGIIIPSMQSIWFGKTEKIFGTEIERNILLDYTYKAIDYAKVINCKNLVFGCPKNRNIDDTKGNYLDIAVDFFKNIAKYSNKNEVVVSIEPNPTIYGTNFINYTKEAIDFVRMIDNNGLKVNIDIGTLIYNNENIEIIAKNIDLIQHIHISEPNLAKIEKRKIHRELSKLLNELEYNNFVSIEMKNLSNIKIIEETIDYVKEVFE